MVFSVFTKWSGALDCFRPIAFPSHAHFHDCQGREDSLQDFTWAIKCSDPEEICLRSAHNQLARTNGLTQLSRGVWVETCNPFMHTGKEVTQCRWALNVSAMELSLYRMIVCFYGNQCTWIQGQPQPWEPSVLTWQREEKATDLRCADASWVNLKLRFPLLFRCHLALCAQELMPHCSMV